MRRLLKLLRLPFVDQRLLVEAAVLTASARLALVVFPFRRIAPWLGRHMACSPEIRRDEDQRTLQRIQFSIRIVSRNMPWKTRCLAQAIAAAVMLRWRRIDGTIYFGIAKEGEQQVIAHAWLRSGRTIVTGAGGLERLAVVSTFAF